MRRIKNEILRKYADIISKYKSINYIPIPQEDNYPIWVMWWQGENKMPDVVKICYASILKNGHYKIFCVNGNTGFRNESRIFNFIHLQNEEEHERKESSSA